MNSSNEQYRFNLGEVRHEDVDQVLSELLESGVFRYPISPEAESQMLDVVQHEYQAVTRAGSKLVEVLQSDPGLGWRDEQITLLGTGFDMALLIIHALEHIR